jgi:hypothetical protein
VPRINLNYHAKFYKDLSSHFGMHSEQTYIHHTYIELYTVYTKCSIRNFTPPGLSPWDLNFKKSFLSGCLRAIRNLPAKFQDCMVNTSWDFLMSKSENEWYFAFTHIDNFEVIWQHCIRLKCLRFLGTTQPYF